MIKALAFGGAFNPPTRAHIDLAHYAMKASRCEKVVFIPSKMSYVVNDQKKNFSFTDEERLNMLERIAYNRPWMDVYPYEINSETQPRTYETLCRLRENGYMIKLLFGSDKLTELETGWKHVDEICRQFGIVCLSRKEDKASRIVRDDPYLRERRDYITVIKSPQQYKNISSTHVRELILSLRQNPDQPDVKKELRELVCEELNGMEEWI